VRPCNSYVAPAHRFSLDLPLPGDLGFPNHYIPSLKKDFLKRASEASVVTVWASSKSPGTDTPADASLCCQQLNTPQAPAEGFFKLFLNATPKVVWLPQK